MSADTEQLVLRPLKRAEYDRLVDAGMFEDEHIELLDGALVEMSPEGPTHAWLIQELTHLLARGLRDDLRLRVGHPWAANDISQPEPDLAVVPHRDYRDGHAQTALLVIEVAASSLAKDLGLKARLYGSAGVPVYWVVDLVDEVVHVHRGPIATGYATVEQHGHDEVLDAAGVTVRIADLLAWP